MLARVSEQPRPCARGQAERLKALTARQRNFGARGPVRAADGACPMSLYECARVFLSIRVAGQDKGGGKNAERLKALTARQRNFGARGPVRAARTALGRSVTMSARALQYTCLRRPKIGRTQIQVGIVMSVIAPLLQLHPRP